MMLCASEVIPECHIIELDDDSIDIEVEVFFPLLCFTSQSFYDPIEIQARESEWEVLPLKSPSSQERHHTEVIFYTVLFSISLLDLWDRVGEKFEISRSRDEWIELTK
jgi:hypothetical protein